MGISGDLCRNENFSCLFHLFVLSCLHSQWFCFNASLVSKIQSFFLLSKNQEPFEAAATTWLCLPSLIHSQSARHSFRAEAVSEGGFIEEKEVAKVISSWEICASSCLLCRTTILQRQRSNQTSDKQVRGCLFYAELRAFGSVPAESPYFKNGNFWDQSKRLIVAVTDLL